MILANISSSKKKREVFNAEETKRIIKWYALINDWDLTEISLARRKRLEKAAIDSYVSYANTIKIDPQDIDAVIHFYRINMN